MKRKQGMMMLAMAGFLVLTGTGIRGAYSYFTQKESVANVFTVGDLKVGLKETEWDPQEGDGKNIHPGYTVYKNPTVKNLKSGNRDSESCYVLMRVKVTDQEGRPVTDEKRMSLIRKTIRYDASYTGNWSRKGSAKGLTEGRIPGYTLAEMEKYPMINPQFEELPDTSGEWLFAYKGTKDQTLKEEEEKILFTNIVIPTEWTEEEMELVGEFQLEIVAEAIQAKGFANREDAFEALRTQK